MGMREEKPWFVRCRCQRTDERHVSNLHDGRPLVAPTTVKVVSRYKSNFSATLKPVGALIERPFGRKATYARLPLLEKALSAHRRETYIKPVGRP